MSASQNNWNAIHASRETRRAPLVGMEFLHQSRALEANAVTKRPRLTAKDIVGFLFGHRERAAIAAPPRCRVLLEVYTPSGLPALEISFED